MTESKRRPYPAFQYLVVCLLSLAFFAFVTGGIYLTTRDNTLGTDFFIYYTAGRQITVNHGSPYDETVGEQSQMAILKHPAGEGEDQLRYVYPPYGLIPILPLTGLPFPWAQAVWMALSIICIPISVLYGFRKVSPLFLLSLFFLYPLTFGLLLGNLNIPVICILFLLAGRVPILKSHQRFESILLGILMAWATIKPQFSSIFILIYLLIAVKNKNKPFIFSFLAGVIGALAFSFILIPNWVHQWIGLLRQYPSYTGGRIPITPIIDRLFPGEQSVVYIILALLLAFVFGWVLLRWWGNKISTIQLLSVGGFVSFFFHPTGVSYEQMIFLFPFILWILQGWQQKPLIYVLWWLAVIISSWIFVSLSLSKIWPDGTYYGTYLVYIIWMFVGITYIAQPDN